MKQTLLIAVICTLAADLAACANPERVNLPKGDMTAWIGELPTTLKSGAKLPQIDETAPRAQLVAGDWSRFRRVFEKLDRGDSLRIAAIGGSITQGAGATQKENRWGEKFAAGWRRAFPNCKIEFINAGIGATGSDIGAFRVQRDVIAHKPDVVVVEFAVNDGPGKNWAESYEGVIRQLLNAPGQIAVIQLAMVASAGNNSQEWQQKVAEHYRIPFVSYRDALYFPYVKEGTIKWSDISPDTVHPNDAGHAYAAALLNWTIEKHYRQFKNNASQKIVTSAMPQPLFGTRFDKGNFLSIKDLKITANNGFFPLKDNCWGEGLACTNANGRLIMEIEGSTIALLYRCGNKPYNWGKIAVKIDGQTVADSLDCYRDQWWWYTPSLFLCRGKPGKHIVEVETKADKNPKSAGYGCHITGILATENE